MGTRGTWGFVLDDREKLTYNHFDSYPDGLGADLLNWLRDSLFCEWAYVIDLDNQRFEVYRGFQTAPHEDGRFATRFDPAEATSVVGETYYPVRKLVDFSLANLPDTDVMIEVVIRAERARSARYYVIDGQARIEAIRMLDRETAQAYVVRRDDEAELMDAGELRRDQRGQLAPARTRAGGDQQIDEGDDDHVSQVRRVHRPEQGCRTAYRRTDGRNAGRPARAGRLG
jgi:hypothetical protein